MIKYKKGNILDADQKIIIAEVPLRSKLEAISYYKEKWDCFYRIYRDLSNRLKPGEYCMIVTNSGQLIMLLPTRLKPNDNANLNWIYDSLSKLYFDDIWGDYSFACPKLGLNNGIKWEESFPIIDQYLSAYDVTIYYQ